MFSTATKTKTVMS